MGVIRVCTECGEKLELKEAGHRTDLFCYECGEWADSYNVEME